MTVSNSPQATVNNIHRPSSPFISDVLPSSTENVFFLKAQELTNNMGVSSHQNDEILIKLDKAGLLTYEKYEQLEQSAYHLKEIFILLSKVPSLDKAHFDYAIKTGSELVSVKYYTTRSKLGGTQHVPYIKV